MRKYKHTFTVYCVVQTDISWLYISNHRFESSADTSQGHPVSIVLPSDKMFIVYVYVIVIHVKVIVWSHDRLSNRDYTILNLLSKNAITTLNIELTKYTTYFVCCMDIRSIFNQNLHCVSATASKYKRRPTILKCSMFLFIWRAKHSVFEYVRSFAGMIERRKPVYRS